MNFVEKHFADKDYPVKHYGAELTKSSKVVILLHGRRQSNEDIYQLGKRLNLEDISYLLPSAPGKTWYPHGFLREIEENQPFLDNALSHINHLIDYLIDFGVNAKNIWLMGFSQGACIASQYFYQFRRRLGGAILFTGGLFGPEITNDTPSSHCLQDMPVLLTGSDTDSWVPESRVRQTARHFERLGAQVTEEIFVQREHLVFDREIELARALLSSSLVV
ncbi:alpha/beta hydrolase [Azotobacter salinestris]|uniref:alpha/beta hydrolase n=1 Tax=Azotobacter salinestris TaxID=69964 RepID=UPI001266A74B|nr:phospholipase [Azotobacter salinestris]